VIQSVSDILLLKNKAVAGFYNLSATGPGAYTIDANNIFHVIEANSSLTPLHAVSNTAEVTIQVHISLWI
jgi:hypothetical protein